MPFIIDTHCHLSSEYDDLTNIIDDSKISNVKMFFDVGYDIESIRKIADNVLEYENLYGIIGIHPDDLKDAKEKNFAEIISIASSNKKIIGIGEIGLDYYHMKSPKKTQHKFFIKQLKIAQKLNLPVSIHLRDKFNVFEAYKDCYEILKELNITKGVLHCFSGNYDYAKKFIDLGLYISFSGVVTFKNGHLTQEVAKKISMQNILVETDSPYLSPDPYRGLKNNPKYIIYTIKKIANLKQIPEHELISQLHKNTMTLFNIKK